MWREAAREQPMNGEKQILPARLLLQSVLREWCRGHFIAGMAESGFTRKKKGPGGSDGISGYGGPV
jgi:hypothetical protein